MDYKDKADKYEKRYWFWQLSGKEYVSFYYMTLAVVLKRKTMKYTVSF